MASRESEIDRAALLGAALAAVVALTFGGQGPWDWIASIAGLALLAVIGAFFHLPAAGDPRRRRQLLPLAGVVGLATTLVVAVPMQLLLGAATPVGERCAARGAVASAAVQGQEHGDVSAAAVTLAADEAGTAAEGECLGAATNRWLWVPAVGFAGLVFVLGVRRSGRSAGSDTA
ncbi:MAG: hypothetical protein OJJ54_00125 [Pseudonocardia sp.]|nr:hypothetical protein [Pseudonocardia sp.]